MGGGARWGISKPFLVLSVRGLEARALARQCQYHPSFIATRTVWHEMGITIVGHRPPCVHHLSTWRNRTWPHLPGLPPLYLHTVSDQVLEVGTAREWGYHDPLFCILYLTWTCKQMHLWNGKDQIVHSCAPVSCTFHHRQMWADLRKGSASLKMPKFDSFQPIITSRHQAPQPFY